LHDDVRTETFNTPRAIRPTGFVIDEAHTATNLCHQIKGPRISDCVIPHGNFGGKRFDLEVVPPFIKAIRESGLVMFCKSVSSLSQTVRFAKRSQSNLLGIVVYAISSSGCVITIPYSRIIGLTGKRLEFGG